MAAIRVELELADGSFTTRMLHAGESVEQFNRSVARSNPALAALANHGISVVRSIGAADNTSKSFLSTLRDVAIVAGIVSIGISKIVNIQSSWVGHIVKINAEMERLNYQMRSMSRASDPIAEAAVQVEYLRDRAKEMPFSLKAITDGFVKLKATGTDPLTGSLQSIADGVAAFGGSDEALQRSILAISQMSGKGVLQMEELRQQLGESMPRAVELMARSMGVSMAKLIKDISTGTVQAKPALEQFYAELERTYGGRARVMMQTFTGQLQRMRTQLQTLVTSGTLKDSFFEGVKDQLRDFNDFLDSNAAKRLANDIGSALAGAVSSIRTAIDWVIRFRSEIANVGIAIAGAFVFGRAISGISSLVGALSTLRLELRATAIGFTALREQQVLHNIMMNSGAPAMTIAAQRLSMVRMAAGSLLAGAAALAPWLAALGLAAYGAAEYFGVFRDRVAEAYDELVKYGSETRRQAQERIQEKIAQLEDLIEAEKELIRESGVGLAYNDVGELVPDETIGKLYLLRKELEEVKKTAATLVDDAGSREDNKMMSRFRDSLDKRMAALQMERDAEQENIQRRYDAEEKGAKDVAAVQEARRQELLDSNRKFYVAQIDIFQTAIEAEKRVYAGSADAARQQSEKRLQYLFQELRQRRELLDGLKAGTVNMLDAPASLDTLLQKGQKNLARIRAEAKGVAAEFTGVNKEVAELDELLRAGRYGDMGLEQVQKLRNELIAAQEAKEKLDDLLEGRNKLQGDIDRAMNNALEKRMELIEKQQGRELTEAQKIQLRIEQGYYKGFGPKSPTRQMLEQIVKSIDAQGTAVNKLGATLRNNAFGPQTEERITSVTERLQEMGSVLNRIGFALGNISFGNFNMPGGFGGRPLDLKNFNGGMLDLIGAAEGTDKGRGYNESLGYGKFTGGPQNLTGMTLDEIDALQTRMLRHPDNNFNSSALGRYQIVQQTLRGLRDQMGLSGDQLFDGKMQDQLATALLQRRGNSLTGLRNEWEGLRRVDDATINRTLMQGRAGPTVAAAAGEAPIPEYTPQVDTWVAQWEEGNRKIAASLVDLDKLNRENEDLGKKTALIEANKKITAEIEAQKLNSDGLNNNYERFVELIKRGELGGSKDVNAEEYKQLLANAKELDRVEKEAADRKKQLTSMNNAEEQFKQRQIDLTNRMGEANARMLDPLEKKSTQAYRALRSELEAYVRDVEIYYGRDSAQYQQALNMKSQMLRQHNAVETAELAAKWTLEAQSIRTGLKTESQARAEAFQLEIARIDAAVAAFQGSEEEKVRIVAAAEEKKAALRAQYQQQINPMTSMMQEWGDLQGNLTKGATQWMGSLADGVTDLLTGTGDLKQMLRGILKDVVNIGVKFAMSQMMGNKSSPANGASKLGGVAKMAAGVAHTGGIVGASRLAGRSVSAGIFADARKFHTGGLIRGPRLGPGEVPIIAKKGEGVFTPEQMEAMGGFGGGSPQISISAPVTVNGSAGTPDQNRDLAEQTARQIEGTMRGVVVDELRRQMRPGNLLNQRAY